MLFKILFSTLSLISFFVNSSATRIYFSNKHTASLLILSKIISNICLGYPLINNLNSSTISLNPILGKDYKNSIVSFLSLYSDLVKFFIKT